MQYPIDKYIAGIGRDFFIHPDHVSELKGYDAAKYIPSLGTTVFVPKYCIDEQGGAEKYIPGLGSQVYIRPWHVVDTEYVEPEPEPEPEE